MPTRVGLKSNRYYCTLSLLDFVLEIIVYTYLMCSVYVDHKHNQPEFHGS
jgi:hypothetical protein